MSDKGGFLLAEETLKLILAFISIVFLSYFLIALYDFGKNSKETELAKASLEHLAGKIEENAFDVSIYNPSGWYITSWPVFSKSKKLSPKYCRNMEWENCICICRGLSAGEKLKITFADMTRGEAFEEVCSLSGVCINTDKKVIVGSYGRIKIPSGGIDLQINYGKEEIALKNGN